MFYTVKLTKQTMNNPSKINYVQAAVAQFYARPNDRAITQAN